MPLGDTTSMRCWGEHAIHALLECMDPNGRRHRMLQAVTGALPVICTATIRRRLVLHYDSMQQRKNRRRHGFEQGPRPGSMKMRMVHLLREIATRPLESTTRDLFRFSDWIKNKHACSNCPSGRYGRSRRDISKRLLVTSRIF